MTLTDTRLRDLQARIQALATNQQRRTLIAIAGPPASGKSTLASLVAAHLSANGLKAEVVPMDGFHLDNAVLAFRGILHRKGAPESFDTGGFCHIVRRLKSDPEVAIPRFDRTRDISIAGAAVIGPDCCVAIVEGNYLLLTDDPWAQLAPLWDLTVTLDVPKPELRARLIRRWIDHGLDPEAAQARAEENDLPNALRVLEHSRRADIIY